MAFYSAASNASLWRGVDYYKENRVTEYVDEGRGIISGLVEGGGDSN